MASGSTTSASSAPKSAVGWQLGIAAIVAVVAFGIQLAAFDCTGLPLLTFVTSILAIGGLAFAIMSALDRSWVAAALALVVATIAFPIMLLSHMCG